MSRASSQARVPPSTLRTVAVDVGAVVGGQEGDCRGHHLGAALLVERHDPVHQLGVGALWQLERVLDGREDRTGCHGVGTQSLLAELDRDASG